MYAATEEHAVRLHEIHTADGSRVERRRFCRAEDREVPAGEVGRGFAMPDGRMVPLTEDDLARLPLPTKRVVEVLGFVPGQDIDPIASSRPYYAGLLCVSPASQSPADQPGPRVRRATSGFGSATSRSRCPAPLPSWPTAGLRSSQPRSPRPN
ncbi:Ku protein [Streptomyces lydicus]|uniref:Ku protein n=1 Tax=Streptomyces lydicus TaxID=47763 RepID=UPI003701F77E